MSTLKEDIARLATQVEKIDQRLQTVEQRLAVVFWLLGIATASITAIAIEGVKRLLNL